MIIKSADFLQSSPSVGKCPENNKMPEYAFIGRSNVGKSSLINMLVNKKGLALTSSKPGKTLLINYFTVNESWYLVDLPGYGYAKASKTQRAKLEQIIKGYILQRRELTNLFVLIDSRHEPQKIDEEFINWLGESGIPFSLIFTKADKLSKGALSSNIENYRNHLLKSWDALPPIFVTSAEKANGRDEVLNYIEQINAEINL